MILRCELACSDAYLAAQQRREWDTSIEDAKSIDNDELNVGLMGLGKSYGNYRWSQKQPSMQTAGSPTGIAC